MAKQRKPSAKPTSPSADITQERFVRLYRMVKLLAGGAQTRENLTRRLRWDVRGFYRDLGLLRSAGVSIGLTAGHYTLEQDADDALALLPFPDPHLTLGAAQTLAQGGNPVHRVLAGTIARLILTR